MNHTVELIERFKEKKGFDTDYKAAKALGIRQSTITNYRKNNRSMEDELGMKIAKELGIDEGEVLAMLAADRATKPVIKKAWEEVAKKLMSSAAGIVGTTLLLVKIAEHCILCKIKEKLIYTR